MKEQIIKLIEEMAISELKEYEGKGDYGPLKMRSRMSAKKHHRKARLFARVLTKIKNLP